MSINIKEAPHFIFIQIVRRQFFAVALLVLLTNSMISQVTQVFKPNINRVLFVLDASGSMKEKWDGKEKFETAKQLLYKLIDSVEKKNSNVEFAVRVFGHQYFRTEKNCRDSKLLVSFAKNNAEVIRKNLDAITPKGMTPIAYSIAESAKDFPIDAKSLNSIILITDGDENCNGNPCASSKYLSDKRISIKPFIVGLNAGEKFAAQLKCAGTVLDTKNETDFYNTVGVIIKQTLNTTSAQINLLDANGVPSVTNIPFTLYDHSTRKILYNFIHTLNEKGNPDTLYLDPVGHYDIEIHATPKIIKENVELTIGKHNIIAVDVPIADFLVEGTVAVEAQIIVRSDTNTKTILAAQDFNKTATYVSGKYKTDLLTTPIISSDTFLQAGILSKENIANAGSIYLNATQKLLFSIFRNDRKQLELVLNGEIAKATSYKLQPGQYCIVYKLSNDTKSESTRTLYFIIEDGRQNLISIP
jgi:Ca-activated chloride channel family protein